MAKHVARSDGVQSDPFASPRTSERGKDRPAHTYIPSIIPTKEDSHESTIETFRGAG